MPVILNANLTAQDRFNRDFFERKDPGVISVTATGVIVAEPDEGYMVFGVVTKAETTGPAVRDNAQKMAEVYRVLEEKGIERKNIQTVQFDVLQAYKQVKIERKRADGSVYIDTETVPDGFQVINTVRVTVCNLEIFGDIIDAVSESANRVSSISFGSSKAEEYRMEARKKAVENAKIKATILTNGLGVGLGRVTSVSEQSRDFIEPAYGANAIVRDSPNEPTEISGGSLAFSTNVNVTWEIQQ
jgi:uncharacterized protein